MGFLVYASGNEISGLAAALLGLRATLANFELGIAFANHVNAAAATYDLAIGVAVLEGSDRANDFHESNSRDKYDLTKCRSVTN
jgi:hypothetical protein